MPVRTDRQCGSSDASGGALISCHERATRQIMQPGMVAIPMCSRHAREHAEATGRPSDPVDWSFVDQQRASDS
jgi:hypothetical protein